MGNRLSKIYTRTGDDGTTGLGDGSRVTKDDPRVEAYGNVDELNSFVGAAVSFLDDQELRAILMDIQRDLFSVGAQLADPKQHGKKQKSKLDPARVAALEETIDRFETELTPLRQFILVGGAPAGAMEFRECEIVLFESRGRLLIAIADSCAPLHVGFLPQMELKSKGRKSKSVL